LAQTLSSSAKSGSFLASS